MIKAVIVKKNKVLRNIVTPSLESVKLGPGESVHPVERSMKYGEKFEGAWSRLLKVIKIK